MAASPLKSSGTVFILGIFGVAWALAGFLVYRWINRVSVADRAQQHHLLRATMRSFRGDFVGALFEIRSTFRPAPRIRTTADLDAYLSAFYAQWHSTDANAPLVDGLSVAEIGTRGKAEFVRLNPQTGRFQPRPWPASLVLFKNRLKQLAEHSKFPPPFAFAGPPFALDGNRPVVVIPLMEAVQTTLAKSNSSAPVDYGYRVTTHRGAFLRSAEGSRRSAITKRAVRVMFPARLTGWCFLELDVHYMRTEFLPSLVERTFGRNGLSDYRVAVITGNPPRMIYDTNPALTLPLSLSPDGALILFTPNQRFGPRFVRLLTQAEGPPTRRVLVARLPLRPLPFASRWPLETLRRSPEAWVLVARNRAGSIEARVARSRRRNLIMGFGALFLLAWSMGSLVVTTRRARELARREMEFVAGVSHELRTPLASIQSAGFNLASGIVRDPNRVEQYGALVQKEAHRLADMVEQVLSYAGIQSGRGNPSAVPTPPGKAIQAALTEYLPVFEQKGWVVEKRISENMPAVLAQPETLERAIKNLLANAMKYAGEGKWVGIEAHPVTNGSKAEVQISVADHGPGIDPADLPHIFEPFYRGKQVLASSVPGSGLGLSILKRNLESYGGRVTVENGKGKGAKFILHLPIAPEQASSAS